MIETIEQFSLGWNFQNWQEPFLFWKENVGLDLNYKTEVLEIGASSISATVSMFANYGCSCTASYYQDAKGVEEYTSMISRDFALKIATCYLDIFNPQQTKKFDIICMKSVLGGLCRHENFVQLNLVLKNIFSLLKPGGYLYLMENCSGTSLHSKLRNYLGAGKNNWHYFKVEKLIDELQNYGRVRFQTFGFFGFADYKIEALNKIASVSDRFIERFVPQNSRVILSSVIQKR